MTQPRRSPRRERSEQVFEAIVDAAARVLEQRGIDGLSTNRVAEVAGVSIGSLYQYFPNKTAMLSVLIDRYLAAFTNAFIRAASTTMDLEALLEKLLVDFADIYQSQRKIHRHLWQARSDAVAHERVAEQHRLFHQAVVGALRAQGRAVGREELTSFVLIQCGNGLVTAISNAHGEVDARQCGRIFVDMVRAVIGGAPSTGPGIDQS